MKKILFAIAIIMMLGMTANAQRDGFFGTWNNDDYRGFGDDNPGISVPSGTTPGEYTGDQPAPLGTGLLILTALGAGYAVARKKR
ncbi:MAG: hypothetical protein K6A73_04600 [Bacteroidales bacterium]|nr:hypothetical protein [Bacteroidales bacterium]